jgi:hypothetical protein
MNVYTKYILTIPNNVDEINGISKGFLIKYIDDIREKYKIFHGIIFDPPPYN